MNLRGASGTIYNIANKPFASGSEGAIHSVPGKALVAKIYKKEQRTPFRQKKVEAMVRESAAFLRSKIAWPRDVLYDANGFVGFVMTRFQNVSMLSVAFTNKTATFKDKLEIARGLARRIKEIHAADQCLGDFSDHNIGVKQTAKGWEVYLFDADSFQFADHSQKRLYRCLMFTEDYTAPEVLYSLSNGQSIAEMKTTPYSKEADLYVLAIHLFKLLCRCHPFAAATVSPAGNNSTMNGRILAGESPFFARVPGLTIPAYAADPHFLPREVQLLFYRALISGRRQPALRVSAAEWEKAMQKLLAKPLKQCKNPAHIYFADNPHCPWCESAKRIRGASQKAASSTHGGGNTAPAHTGGGGRNGAGPLFTRVRIPPAKPKLWQRLGFRKRKVSHSVKFWVITLLGALGVQGAVALAGIGVFKNLAEGSAMSLPVLCGVLALGLLGTVMHNRHVLYEKARNYIGGVISAPIASVAVVFGGQLLGALGALLLAGAVIFVIMSILFNL